MSENPLPPKRIANPHANIPNTKRVQADIDPLIYHYFFRKVLAGHAGMRAAFISHFFQRFYEACLAAEISPVYSDDNEQRVATILERLNFDARVLEPTNLQAPLTEALSSGPALDGGPNSPSPENPNPRPIRPDLSRWLEGGSEVYQSSSGQDAGSD